MPAPYARPRPSLADRLHAIDWVPDLGAQIGSRDWWRGAATCLTLCAAALALSPAGLAPGWQTIPGATPAPEDAASWDQTRAQGIAPLAWGADTGHRMAANDLVAPLAEAPERPVIELSATLGEGDAFDRALVRAGVGRGDARQAAALVSGVARLSDIAEGTQIKLTLGRRPNRTVARPLEALSLRARFDMAVTLTRAGDGLVMTRKPIAIDNTPWRIQGLVGRSLYRSARAAGVPAKIVESYIKALATRLSIGRDVDAADTFDMVIARERAATGETRTGGLLFAGLDQAHKRLRLAQWGDAKEWFDADGQTERRGTMGLPVSGRVTSTFGMRMHPLLGFLKMHKGMDIGAPLWRADLCRDGRRGAGGRTCRRLRQFRQAGACRRPGHRLRPYEPHRGARGHASTDGASDRLCRLDRPVDRPAPPLGGVAQRREHQPAPHLLRPGRAALGHRAPRVQGQTGGAARSPARRVALSYTRIAC